MVKPKDICIAGTGGLAREVLMCLKDCMSKNPNAYSQNISFMEKDEYYENNSLEGIPIIRQSNFDPKTQLAIIAVGDVNLRKQIANALPSETRYATLVHPSATITKTTIIKEGSVVMAGAVLSCNIELGKHTIVDRLSTIGHDCSCEDFFHLAPLSVLSGNINVEEQVFVGSGSAIKEGIAICSNTLIGMGSVVVKNIDQPGTYVGNPAKKIK